MTRPPEAAIRGRSQARSRIRGVRHDDADAVMQLFRRHGWPLRSPAGWNWALFDNPVRQQHPCEAGWVLEVDGQVVGFLGNIPATFHLNGQPLVGATCTSLLVDTAHRAPGMGLVRAFAAQKGMAFVYSATANGNSAPLYRAYGYRASNELSCNQRWRWVVSRRAIARALLERLHLGWVLPRGGLHLPWQTQDPIRVTKTSGGQGLRSSSSKLHVDRVLLADLADARNSTTRDAWDAWAQVLSSHPGLHADRCAQTMCWRLGDPDLSEDELALFALRDCQGHMLGSSLVRRLPYQRGHPGKAELVDLAVLPSCGRQEVGQLLQACQRWARARHAAVLDAKRWTGASAAALCGFGAQVSKLPSDSLWLRESKASSSETPVDWHIWSMTGIDSDDWFNTLKTDLPAESPRSRSAGQAAKAALSACTNSSKVSTLAGSNSSISSV